MRYLLRPNCAELIKNKYKNNYIATRLDLSATYVSLVLHRKRAIAKHLAYAFTKVIDSDANVEDLFEAVE